MINLDVFTAYELFQICSADCQMLLVTGRDDSKYLDYKTGTKK